MGWKMRCAAAFALGGALAVASHDGTVGPPTARAAGPVEVFECHTATVVVLSGDEEDAASACSGAHDATTFLASQGLSVEDSITVELVEALPDAASSSALGCYLDRERRAAVLTYAAARRRESWFGLPIDRSLYQSLVAHEVAHAIAACNFKPAKPSIQAQEYVAYITMFATMAPDQREVVLARYPGDGYEDDAQMSSIVYLFDPLRFGAEAYRHFLKPTNGRDYLRRVLEGKALVE